jgi:hypothetical protein
MPRTPPSVADQGLIQLLAQRGVTITSAQLERWRAAGYLPRNSRAGLGRGMGSWSASTPGLPYYLEALATTGGQGRRMDRPILALFMAGVLQPTDCPATDALMQTYEAAVCRAFRREIINEAAQVEEVACLANSSENSVEEAEDAAFARAEELAKRHVTNSALHLERLVASLEEGSPRTRAEKERDDQYVLLKAAGISVPDPERSDDQRSWAESWTVNRPQLDAAIFASHCDVCADRTVHQRTSVEGQLEILESACFCQLNRARAIGGSAFFQLADIRDMAVGEPVSHDIELAFSICASTAFQFALRNHRIVTPWQPQSIVMPTLFMTADCRWQLAGAALLLALGRIKSPHADKDPLGHVKMASAMAMDSDRAAMLRKDAVAMGLLLCTDGILSSAELLQLRTSSNFGS